MAEVTNDFATHETGSPDLDVIPTIVARDVHVTYRSFEDAERPTLRRLVARGFRPRPYRAVHAVRGVSLVAYPGEAFGVIGRNGSGKSTLLRTIAGLMPPTSGEVHARSVPVLLGVQSMLDAELSGRRNIYLGATALGFSRREVAERFDEIVDFAGLRDFIDLPLKAYSSGMASRLHFAIASSVRPDILLIDEALAVGDEEFRRKSQRRIRELVEDAGTVFVVSHSLGSVTQMCSHAIWMDRGVVAAEGPAEEVVEAYRRDTEDRTTA